MRKKSKPHHSKVRFIIDYFAQHPRLGFVSAIISALGVLLTIGSIIWGLHIQSISNTKISELTDRIASQTKTIESQTSKIDDQGRRLTEINAWFNKLNNSGQRTANRLLDRYLQSEARDNNWEAVNLLTGLMLAINPQDQSALNSRGQYARQFQDDCQSATKYYQQSLAVNSNNKYAADALVYLGICAFRRGSIDEAAAYFKRAIAIDPNYYDAKYWLKKT